ncbi:MAG: hypothetical protein P8Q97_15125 [Myxococcota bacterium]|nr:hypothetical protein [Myxococcota bacterium]
MICSATISAGDLQSSGRVDWTESSVGRIGDHDVVVGLFEQDVSQ